MKKVGVLYICTGEYWKFWRDFYISSEQYFLNDAEVHYYIFTNNAHLLDIVDGKIHPIYLKAMEWPFTTLKRFEFFHLNRGLFINMEYLFFCNANLLFLKNVSLNQLFVNNTLLAIKHPGFENSKPDSFTDEKNVNSLAFIKRNKNSKYVCGGFNGGQTIEFLRMSEYLMNNINLDLEKDIVAIWHDESHLNNYVESHRELFLIKSSDFCKPEECKNEDTFVTVRNKSHLISLKHKGFGYLIRGFFIKIYKKFKI
jgi:hypothetical protein